MIFMTFKWFNMTSILRHYINKIFLSKRVCAQVHICFRVKLVLLLYNIILRSDVHGS